MLLALLFPLLLGVALASNTTCPAVLPNPRIVGGTSATFKTRSFLVSLANASDVFSCTGSLLSKRWVLTAAHCKVKRDWKLRIHPDRATSGPTIAIKNVFVHERYPNDPDNPDGPGDITLVELEQDAPNTASFMRINANATAPVPGAFARAAGYGRTRRPGQDRRNSPPFQVDGPVNSPVKCASIYKGFLQVKKDWFVCVGYGKNGCVADSCHGDSGGPLFQFDGKGRPVQIGVVSFGLECGVKGVPGVHVRVSNYVKWMESKGAKFTKSSAPLQVFGKGSKEAASDEASITVLQVLGEEEGQNNNGDLTISKVTFVVICVVAGIALIGFIFLSLFFVSGRNRSERQLERAIRAHLEREEGREGGQGEEPASQDKLQMAISLLQAITYEQAMSSGSGQTIPSGTPPRAGRAGNRQSTRNNRDAERRQQSTLSDATIYMSARELSVP